MKDNIAMLKLLLFLTFTAHLSSADTHTLQYLYTAVRPGVHFTAVGLVDGEQFVFYDINMMMRISAWMKKAEADDPDYWQRETEHVQNQQDSFQNNVARVMKRFNQSEGVHTLQRIYGCECDDDGTTRGYDEYGYDGEDFISLDLKTGTWTATNDKAKNFINEWDPNGDKAKHWNDFLKTDCIDQLQKVLNDGKETLERKVPPTASVFQKNSSSPEVVCHATGFFPKTVNITWQKDGEDVHEDVKLNETLPNQDGSFQKRIILTVSAEDLQKHTYTCVIQHSSLEKEIVLPVSERRILNPDRRTGGGSGGGSDEGSGGGSGGAPIGIIVGVVVAFVVFIAGVAGIVVWKKKNSVFTPVPLSDSTPVPVSDSTPVPVSDSTPVPLSDSTPVPPSDYTPVPLSDSTPVPPSDYTPVPLSDSTPVPLSDSTPVPLSDSTPVPLSDYTSFPLSDCEKHQK
ncbi:BOLA class I histocompatibility antigen, alpha chain BL3-7-like isoform X2 [Ictalurus furcatus]|uniref:BOLA class I histocompatibility antigen, alpha chain BL3-7-like isoform X2 n=1 Tax=Ictalurus furcatus TaxID=66913 RepID=UPI00235001C6|nr:BOLA class I histocompatibility antigen, alpha chain BL3-7-like isoform X2 [Ictalurus furcatus]